MTEVNMPDGSKMETNLPPEAVADLQAKPAEQPADLKPDAPEASQTKQEQAAEAKAEEPKEPEKPAEKQEQAPKEEGRRPKPKPIATLLEKKHEAEVRAETAERERDELKAKIAEISKQPDNTATDNDIKAFAEETGIEVSVLERLIGLARKGFEPAALPKEVQDLIADHQTRAQVEQEETAYSADFQRLNATIKDPLLADAKVQERLKELAYSEDKAPDGEPFYQKPLYELFMNFARPEFEPGKGSAEPARGGSQATPQVLDFKEIVSDPVKLEEFSKNASSEQFSKFHQWQLEHEKEPITRRPSM